MITLHADVENNHYFYVMAWKSKDKRTAPAEKKRFDIYKDAVKYYDALSRKYSYVEMFEKIGESRKPIMNTEDDE